MSCSTNVTRSRLFSNVEQTHRPAIPFFRSETLFSCLEVCPSCSETLLSCLELRSSCSELRLICSNMVSSYSDKAPFWYSRSLAFDSARSHSRWAPWAFFSISFIASFSFAFSSARGSILLIRCCRCLAVHAMPYKSLKIIKNPIAQRQRRTLPMQY